MITYPKEWHKIKISDLGYFYSGLSGKKAEDFGKGNAYYITFLNVLKNNIVDFGILEKVRIDGFETQNEVKLNDLLFNTSSETPEEVGMCAAVTIDAKNVYLNSFCFGFRLFNKDEILPLYASYLFNSKYGRESVVFATQGSTRYNLSKRYFSKIELTIPPLSEQSEIVSVLIEIDNHIENLTNIIEKKTQIREGVLSELLSGKTRILNFQNKWVETTLADITKQIITGGTPSTLIDDFWGGDIPWLSSTEIHQKNVTTPSKYITNFGLQNSSAQIVPANSVLIALAGQGKTRGSAAYLTIPMAINQSLAALVSLENIDSKFLYYLMESKYAELRELSSGDGGRGGLNKSILKKIVITIPTELNEQIEISASLTLIDEEIELLMKEKDKLVKIKDGVLDQVLIGSIRLK
ncbi:MAG: restriction endonuclease subunit S [Acholeplasma sp.]|jgi:type I restriction enzyme S subunit|nr:restriction endonuclease subunit S [Acholeplasma sp.]